MTHPMTHNDLSDDELLALIGQGQQKAGAILVERHLSYVLHICRRKLGHEAEAEEAAQDVFTSVWKNAANWQPGQAKVSTWLYRIAVNRCIDILRRRRPTTDIAAIAEPADERADIEKAAQVSDRNRLIQNALTALTDDQQQAIELVYFKEMKQRDAAELMGVTLAALESILRRARSGLHQQLAAQRDYLEVV
ncbi:MAG: sigma-70 family RNA polymerase sigma factor [Parvibaculales bacterium]